jgi:electron transfer flavoprotein beta subunit
MHIIVCVKQIPDPESAFSMLKVDEQSRQVIPSPGLPLVMSPFDEQALEAALRVRESIGEVKITAISMGPESVRSTLKHALAMGADEALLVNDEGSGDAGGEVTALVLSRAIVQLGGFDLVLTGRQAADWDAGIVGCGIAELLELPVITFGRKVEMIEGHVRVERVLADGFEVLEAELPAVVTVSNEIGPARKPSLRETMRAARKPLKVCKLSDVGVAAEEVANVAARRVRERVYVPVNRIRCELIAGADENAQASILSARLREARLI